HALSAPPVALLLLVLLGDQPPRVAAEVVRRLAITGQPGQRFLRVLEETGALTARLRATATRSGVARLLRPKTALELTWLWLTGDASIRRRLTRFVEHDASVEPWLRGDEIVALGIAPGA